MTQKAKMGGWPGRAPIGYVNVRERFGARDVAKVDFDPERAMLVREAFRLYATGEYSILELQATMHAKTSPRPMRERQGPPCRPQSQRDLNPCLHLESVLGSDFTTCSDARIRSLTCGFDAPAVLVIS